MEEQLRTLKTRLVPFDRNDENDLKALDFIEQAFKAYDLFYNLALNWLVDEGTKNQRVPSYHSTTIHLQTELKLNVVQKAYKVLRDLHFYGHILLEAARDAHTAVSTKFKEIKSKYIKQEKYDKKVNLRALNWNYRREKSEYRSFSYLPQSQKLSKTMKDKHTFCIPAGIIDHKSIYFTVQVNEDLHLFRRDLEEGYKRIHKICITKERDNYFICITFSIVKESPRDRKKKPRQPRNGTRIGIDLGVKTSATTYNGKSNESIQFNPNRARKAEESASKLQSKLAHMARGSKRYRRLENKIAKLQKYAARCREYVVYCYIKRITSQYKKIVVDSFTMKQATRSKKKSVRKQAYRSMKYFFEETLSRKVASNKNQLQYLNKVVKGAKFLPTTQTCSHCLKRDFELTNKGRTYKCKTCGSEMDRDVNAAHNIYHYKKLVYIKSRTKKPKKTVAKKKKSKRKSKAVKSKTSI